MSKNKPLNAVPQLDLKGDDFIHEIPDHIDMELYVEWRDKNAVRDSITNVRLIQKEGKELRIVNRNSNSRYIYNLKEVRKVYIICEANALVDQNLNQEEE